MIKLLTILSVTAFVTPLVAASEWINLLANDSLEQWSAGPDSKGNTPKSIGGLWSLNDGVLHLNREPQPEGTKKERGGFIVTKKKYWNFELKFDFKISHNGNSGIKYRTDDKGLGLEYQIIDDVNYRDNKTPSHRSCALYEIKAADETKKDLGTAGKTWNSGRILAVGNKIQHWINGNLVMEIDYNSEEWKKLFKKSKYFRKGFHHFGSTPGSILIQDHQNTVSYKNVLIRELDGPSAVTPPPTPKSKTPEKKKKKAAPKVEIKEPVAFLNCKACHALDKTIVGPTLINIRNAYPAESLEYFIEWCLNPGKKRPLMPQMPSMAHIPKEQLAEIHEYILAVTKGLQQPKEYAKKDLFKDTKRPRVLRTFTPESSPASIVICLDTPEKHNIIWDSVGCHIAYITKGEFDNWPYLRSSGNALASPGKKVYTNEDPIRTNTQYNGYRINADGLPTFLYSIGGKEFSDTVSHSAGSITVGNKTISL